MITIENGVTEESKKEIFHNLPFIGKVKSVYHERDKRKIYYKTIIEGSTDSIVAIGGITSGFGGTGPSGFVDVLSKLGVQKAKAERYVKGNQDEKHSFKIDL